MLIIQKNLYYLISVFFDKNLGLSSNISFFYKWFQRKSLKAEKLNTGSSDRIEFSFIYLQLQKDRRVKGSTLKDRQVNGSTSHRIDVLRVDGSEDSSKTVMT